MGKTELIEQVFRNDQIIKFEGIQTNPAPGRTNQKALQKQLDNILHRLNLYEVPYPPDHDLKSWTDFLKSFRLSPKKILLSSTLRKFSGYVGSITWND